jgi:MbtH protein
MSMFEMEDAAFCVVVNHEDQWSIWPADRPLAPGWRAAGKSGAKQECLTYIEEHWTDMRPLRLRRQAVEATVAGAGRG